MTRSLNVEKLKAAHFFERFLGFVERRDEVFFGPETNYSTVNVAEKWIKAEDYDTIRYYLHDTHAFRFSCPFSLQDFVSMNDSTFEHWKDYALVRCALNDEQDALYDEFISFYDVIPC